MERLTIGEFVKRELDAMCDFRMTIGDGYLHPLMPGENEYRTIAEAVEASMLPAPFRVESSP